MCAGVDEQLLWPVQVDQELDVLLLLLHRLVEPQVSVSDVVPVAGKPQDTDASRVTLVREAWVNRNTVPGLSTW